MSSGERSTEQSRSTIHYSTNPLRIVIVVASYHVVYWSYRASRPDRWFVPCSIPSVPRLPEASTT